jgi:hypothetical protein
MFGGRSAARPGAVAASRTDSKREVTVATAREKHIRMSGWNWD